MEKFSKLVFISTLISNSNNQQFGSDIPRWLKAFTINLECDSYYLGSIMYRYYWKNEYYFQLEVPSDAFVFCQVINFKGEFLKWPNNLYQEFVDGRSQEKIIWESKLKIH